MASALSNEGFTPNYRDVVYMFSFSFVGPLNAATARGLFPKKTHSPGFIRYRGLPDFHQKIKPPASPHSAPLPCCRLPDFHRVNVGVLFVLSRKSRIADRSRIASAVSKIYKTTIFLRNQLNQWHKQAHQHTNSKEVSLYF